MKIDDKDILSSSLQNIAKAAAGNISRRTAASSSTTSASSGDAVHLNSDTQILSAASTAGESARAARVAELRKIYVTGQPSINAQDLSRAIVDAHLSGD